MTWLQNHTIIFFHTSLAKTFQRDRNFCKGFMSFDSGQGFSTKNELGRQCKCIKEINSDWELSIRKYDA